MKTAWMLALVCLIGVVSLQAHVRVVWVTTIHRGETVTIGRTYLTRARALADAARTPDPDIWIVIQPSELVRGR